MDRKTLKALKSLYAHDNTDYDAARRVSTYRESALDAPARALAEAVVGRLNEVVFVGHDDTIARLIAMRTDRRLSPERVAAEFVAGVGGSWPRGVSGLTAYQHVRHLAPHPHSPTVNNLGCYVCGFSDRDRWENASWMRYAMALGANYGTSPAGAWVGLVDLAEQPPVAPTADDVRVFQALLQLLEDAPPDETPGKFELRLRSTKLLSHQKYGTRGILNALAWVGVIPNAAIALDPAAAIPHGAVLEAGRSLKNTQGRSDMEMPWAAWQGRLGVDRARAAAVFGELAC